ncbi:MAG: Type 1 glutamine amidotransferase-like domain-containing protein, partial [Candidatus Komeilibacteria bacterium]|nr:Type 1 glutamine amidotransferase-like domain-containing protein [Candidatus Komeilibacteria bacterium]
NKEISDTFLKLINKPVDQIHVIFIPTASRTEHELKYVEESRQELIDLGINNIVTLNLERKVTTDDLKNVDVIYVCGGNTFYLLKKMRESDFDQLLPSFNGLYLGVSAGSIVVGPNIEVSGPWDENDVNLSDTTGMNIVNFAVIPHYQTKEHAIVENLKNKASYEIVPLTDNQAILINGNDKIVIGQP